MVVTLHVNDFQSMGLCFIGKRDYAKFITEVINFIPSLSSIVISMIF